MSFAALAHELGIPTQFMSKYSSGSYVGVEQISYSTLGHTFGQVEPLVIGRTNSIKNCSFNKYLC
jgi:hypothetical protein